MTDDDNPYRRFRPETYEQALARCEVLKPDAGLTEQDKAERLAFDLAIAKRHDAFFAASFQDFGGVKISAALAGQFGVQLTPYNQQDDDGDMGGLR